MGIVGFLALAANLASVGLLIPYKDGDANVRSVWLCSRNDAIGNVVVMAAALGVWGTSSAWPDLAVAALMAGIFLTSSVQICGRPGPNIAKDSDRRLCQQSRTKGYRAAAVPPKARFGHSTSLERRSQASRTTRANLWHFAGGPPRRCPQNKPQALHAIAARSGRNRATSRFSLPPTFGPSGRAPVDGAGAGVRRRRAGAVRAALAAELPAARPAPVRLGAAGDRARWPASMGR